MIREITDHIVNGDLPQNQIHLYATDNAGAGGANYRYIIGGMDLEKNRSAYTIDKQCPCVILFQNGPIKEAGLNGITQEVLLAIVIDRLRSFQAGPFPCDENAEALSYCEMALDVLKSRTEKRLARGVEGETKA